MRKSISVSLIALIAATPALAQEATDPPSAPADTGAPAVGEATAPDTAQVEPVPPADEALTDSDVDAIVVTAARIRGEVDTDIPPVLELDEAQVAAYGAASIADLVEQLSPVVGSGRGRGGRPVFLVNGLRITNFREIGRYPPEAVRKVEVLPEEVAVRFGYPPDQRVINFILKDSFASREVEVEAGMPTRGGYGTGQAELSMLRITGQQRLNASLDYTKTTPLTEAERDIIQTPGNVPTVASDPDPADFRTLIGRSDQLEANVTSTVGLGESGSAGQITLNSQWVHNAGSSLSGLDLYTAPDGEIRVIDDDPIMRRTNSDTLSLGAGYSTRLGGFQFQTTLDGGLTDTESTIDRRRTAPGPVVTDYARSKVWNASAKSTLVGHPLLLPAGELGLTLNAGYDWNRIESFDTRTLAGNNTLTRGDLSGGVNLAIPISSRRDDVWAAIGDLSFNLGGGVNHLSDFGTLWNGTGSLMWRPTEKLTLQASYVMREAAPGLNQLGGPIIINYNVPTYDFGTNQSVLITQTTGGNPFLQAETQRDLKLSASYDLDFLGLDRANARVEYFRNRSSDVTSSFPLLTPEIEAAFPERVTRDQATGRLTALDARPVTFAEVRSERLRYGINLFGRLGEASPEGEGRGGGRFALMAAAQPAAAAAPASAPAPAPTGEAAPGAVGEQQAPGTRRPRRGFGMDPQHLAELRTQFCASPEGTVPDLTALPQQMQDRLTGENGEVDPARVAVMRQRLCNPDAARRFDPARFAAMRQALCTDMTKDPDPAAIPEAVRDRLKGQDGTISPERLREFRTRICALQTGQGRGQRRGQASGGEPPAPTGAQPTASATPPAEGAGPQRGGGMGFGRGGGGGQGRWNVSLYHTVNLASSVLVAPGGPLLDLLDGSATGSGGGVSRHQLELEGGVFYKGVGLRLSGNYNSGTTVRGSGLPGSSDLFFGDLATFDLRGFVQLDQQKWLVGEDAGFFKNARLSLRVNNLFDARQRVTDANGVVPLRYQPFLTDPVGRFVEIEFRKLF